MCIASYYTPTARRMTDLVYYCNVGMPPPSSIHRSPMSKTMGSLKCKVPYDLSCSQEGAMRGLPGRCDTTSFMVPHSTMRQSQHCDQQCLLQGSPGFTQSMLATTDRVHFAWSNLLSDNSKQVRPAAAAYSFGLGGASMSSQPMSTSQWCRTWGDHAPNLRPSVAPSDSLFPHSLGGGPGAWQKPI